MAETKDGFYWAGVRRRTGELLHWSITPDRSETINLVGSQYVSGKVPKSIEIRLVRVSPADQTGE